MINQITVNSTDADEIEGFCELLYGVSKNIKIHMIYASTELELMRMPWFLRLFRFFMSREKFKNMIYSMLISSDEFREGCWKNTIEHIKFGKDKTCAESAGGFSQKELDTFIEALYASGYRL